VDSAAQTVSPPVVVIGASAGGTEALLQLVGGPTDELGAVVVVVLPQSDSVETALFERRAMAVTERAGVIRGAIGRGEAAVDDAEVTP
jgi:chemotaxis response regulator CheB